MTPLELWDLCVGDRILWDVMLEPEFPVILRQILASLRQGGGATRSEGPVPTSIAGFDSLYVTGRRAAEPQIREHLSELGCPVLFSRSSDFPGQEPGLRLLVSFGSPSGWTCDLGQTGFKLGSTLHRRRFERDLNRLPIRTDGPGESTDHQRRELRRWLAESLRIFSRHAGPPDAVLFALPSRLDDRAIPEGSSYIGMAGDGALVGDVLAASGLTPRRILVMNDAELAALDAIAEPALRACAKTLVVTLGFGLGAALVFRT